MMRGMPRENQQYLEQEYRQFELRGDKDRTIEKHLWRIGDFIERHKNEDLMRVTRREIEDYIVELNRSDKTVSTKEDIKRGLKMFLADIQGRDAVSWLHVNRHVKSSMTAADLLHEEDVQRMIGMCRHLRDKAMIAVAFDAGLRPCELLGLRLSDLELDGEPAHITVSGKTGPRTVPITFSTRLLREYVHATPRLDGGAIWERDKHAFNPGRLLYAGYRKMLARAAREGGITKRVIPYTLRHSRITEYAEFMTDRELMAYFGTTLLSTYAHMTTRELDGALARKRKEADLAREVHELKAMVRMLADERKRS